MHIKVQGRLMQARFIEIHQVFAKKKVGYFYNRVVYSQIFFIENFLLLQTHVTHSRADSWTP